MKHRIDNTTTREFFIFILESWSLAVLMTSVVVAARVASAKMSRSRSWLCAGASKHKPTPPSSSPNGYVYLFMGVCWSGNDSRLKSILHNSFFFGESIQIAWEQSSRTTTTTKSLISSNAKTRIIFDVEQNDFPVALWHAHATHTYSMDCVRLTYYLPIDRYILDAMA